jgi:hypothetical protein
MGLGIICGKPEGQIDMNKRRRVARQKRHKTRERLKAKEREARQQAGTTTTRRSSSQ